MLTKALLLTLLVAAVLGPRATDAFRLFRRSEAASSGNTSIVATTRPVSLLARAVDAADPYYRSMTFNVPLELNYMLGDYLYREFIFAVGHHCNFSTANVTLVVRNDLQVIKSDTDVWGLKDDDRIEVWTSSSGSPTRAGTLAAWAKGAASKWQQQQKRNRTRTERPQRGQKGGSRRGSGSFGADATVDVTSETSIGEEPIVVPNWDQLDDY